METSNPIDQTRLTLAVLTACFVKTFSERDESFRARFEQNLTKAYKEVRESELSHIGTMETLRWVSDYLKDL